MDFVEIIKKGKYFCPAYKHYGRVVNVMCDRCKRSRLRACIGHGDLDLCLECVDELTKIYDAKSLIYFPTQPELEQEIPENIPMTYMESDRFFSLSREYDSINPLITPLSIPPARNEVLTRMTSNRFIHRTKMKQDMF
jgi:hypothetical protein